MPAGLRVGCLQKQNCCFPRRERIAYEEGHRRITSVSAANHTSRHFQSASTTSWCRQSESSWPIGAAETSPRCFPSHVIMFRSQLQCRAFHVILHQRPLAPRSQTFLRVSAFLPLPPRRRVCCACSPAGVCSSVNDLYPSNVASLLFPKQTFNVKVVSDFLRSF